MSEQTVSVVNLDPTPAPADQLGVVIEMGRHVDAIYALQGRLVEGRLAASGCL